jgi:hypothetical protein
MEGEVVGIEGEDQDLLKGQLQASEPEEVTKRHNLKEREEDPTKEDEVILISTKKGMDTREARNQIEIKGMDQKNKREKKKENISQLKKTKFPKKKKKNISMLVLKDRKRKKKRKDIPRKKRTRRKTESLQ